MATKNTSKRTNSVTVPPASPQTPDIRYTTTHEWVRMENATVAVIGLTEYGLKNLGDLVAIDLPELEEDLLRGKPFCEVESVQHLTDIFSPVSGEVVACNEEIQFNIDLLNQDPYGRGWILKLKIEDANELDDLMTQKAYEKHISAGK